MSTARHGVAPIRPEKCERKTPTGSVLHAFPVDNLDEVPESPCPKSFYLTATVRTCNFVFFYSDKVINLMYRSLTKIKIRSVIMSFFVLFKG
jgi:hypothetical protein